MCLNTVAVLFLLEVDNLAFLHGLGERDPHGGGRDDGARQVTDEAIQTINTAKIVCVLAIPAVVLAGPWGPGWLQILRGFFRGNHRSLAVHDCVVSATYEREQTQTERGLRTRLAGEWPDSSWLIWYFGMGELAWAKRRERGGRGHLMMIRFVLMSHRTRLGAGSAFVRIP